MSTSVTIGTRNPNVDGVDFPVALYFLGSLIYSWCVCLKFCLRVTLTFRSVSSPDGRMELPVVDIGFPAGDIFLQARYVPSAIPRPLDFLNFCTLLGSNPRPFPHLANKTSRSYMAVELLCVFYIVPFPHCRLQCFRHRHDLYTAAYDAEEAGEGDR